MPSVYQLAKDQQLKFFIEIDDCLAVIAAVFGGGRQAWHDLTIYELLQWTDRAITYQQREAELATARQGI